MQRRPYTTQQCIDDTGDFKHMNRTIDTQYTMKTFGLVSAIQCPSAPGAHRVSATHARVVGPRGLSHEPFARNGMTYPEEWRVESFPHISRAHTEERTIVCCRSEHVRYLITEPGFNRSFCHTDSAEYAVDKRQDGVPMALRESRFRPTERGRKSFRGWAISGGSLQKEPVRGRRSKMPATAES